MRLSVYVWDGRIVSVVLFAFVKKSNICVLFHGTPLEPFVIISHFSALRFVLDLSCYSCDPNTE